MTEVIQPMPELTAEEFDALRSDIAANGVLVPIVKDQHGRILDGNHRAAIAAELGIDYPVIVVEVADDQEAYDRAVSLNCARRHLNREQIRDLVESEIRRRPDDSDRAIARRVGCSPSTVGTVRAHLRIQAEAITEQIRGLIHDVKRRLDMRALRIHHRHGQSWQAIGDVLDRLTLAEFRAQVSELSNKDRDYLDPDDFWRQVFDPFWRYVWGPFFDDVRATDCGLLCQVCTDQSRKWRDDHPEQVYRYSDHRKVSNLDTEAAVEI